MIAYLINFVLCSGLLWLVYRLFLSSEQMYRFNRFYLLFSLLFSLTVPLLRITIRTNVLPVYYPQTIEKPVAPAETKQQGNQQLVKVSSEDNWPLIVDLIYVLITLTLTVRFVKNLYRINRAALRNTIINYHNYKLILLEDDITPHSFLKYIFINKYDYRNGHIEPEIICHEQTHVRQLHSLDILFVELLQVVVWFNPFIPLYKRDIQLNHEFLADDAVIKNFRDKTAYQYLLFAKASQAKSLKLTSEFNYLTTKKRFIMMTKNTSSKMAIMKQFTVAPLFILSIFLFCHKVVAQSLPKAEIEKDSSTINRNTENLVEEFKDIFIKYGARFGHKGIAYPSTTLSKEDQDIAITLFKKMNVDQQQQVHSLLFPMGTPWTKILPKISPSDKQIKAWRDPSQYGVWIDGKKIKNNEIDAYNESDFDQYFVSRLTKTALHHNEYAFQVNLMTKTYYAQYYKQEKNQQNQSIALAAMFPSPR
jgi:hypothetical protein